MRGTVRMLRMVTSEKAVLVQAGGTGAPGRVTTGRGEKWSWSGLVINLVSQADFLTAWSRWTRNGETGYLQSLLSCGRVDLQPQNSELRTPLLTHLWPPGRGHLYFINETCLVDLFFRALNIYIKWTSFHLLEPPSWSTTEKGLRHRDLFSHRCAGWKSVIEVLVGLISSEASLLGW